MAKFKQALDKARAAERKASSTVKKMEREVEARVGRVLQKDGPAEKLAARLDKMADEMQSDIERLRRKWAKQFKALGDAIQAKTKSR